MSSKGFTLLEILVVITIIVILLALTFSGLKTGSKTLALERATHKLAQDLKFAQKMTLGFETTTICSSLPRGYGIYFPDVRVNPYKYIIYADCDGDQQFNPGEGLEEIDIEKGVKLKHFYLPRVPGGPRYTADVFFERTTLWVITGPGNELEIILTLEDNPNTTSSVYVNRAGLIEITQRR